MNAGNIVFILILLSSVIGCERHPEPIVVRRYSDNKLELTYEINKGTIEDPVDYYYRSYYQNGNLMKEGRMLDHKEQDEWKYYYESGKLSSTGNFKSGMRTGPFVRYYESGETEQKGMYMHDTIAQISYYYHNGRLRPKNIDYTAYIQPNVKTKWTREQRVKVQNRLKQGLRYDDNYNPSLCECLVDTAAHHIEFVTMDTLSDYDRGKIYRLLMENGKCK